jgi:glycerol kinase
MGMTQYTTKAHIVRAALEGIAYQTREVKYSFLFFSSKIYF